MIRPQVIRGRPAGDATANGLDSDHPRLAPCRDHKEE